MTQAILPVVPNIDQGLPKSREDWPNGVLDALQKFALGSVVRQPPLFYFAEPTYPVWARTRQYTSDSTGPEVVETSISTSPRYGLITSQTCDIVEDGKDQPIYPWVQIVPIYDREDLNSGLKKLIGKGKGPKHFIHVPKLVDGFWVADMRIEFPVEKGWLAQQDPIDGFEDEQLQRRSAERISHARLRPAFAKSFVEEIQQPLVVALRDLKRNDPACHQRIVDQVAEIAIRADSLLAPSSVQVIAILESQVDDDITEWWQDWWDSTAPRAKHVGITLLPLEYRRETEITLAEYRRMTVMPLERISPE